MLVHSSSVGQPIQELPVTARDVPGLALRVDQEVIDPTPEGRRTLQLLVPDGEKLTAVRTDPDRSAAIDDDRRDAALVHQVELGEGERERVVHRDHLARPDSHPDAAARIRPNRRNAGLRLGRLELLGLWVEAHEAEAGRADPE